MDTIAENEFVLDNIKISVKKTTSRLNIRTFIVNTMPFTKHCYMTCLLIRHNRERHGCNTMPLTPEYSGDHIQIVMIKGLCN